MKRYAGATAALFALVPMAGAQSEDFGNSEVHLDFTAVAEYDSNIFANSSEESDYTATFTPAFRYTRDKAVTHLDFVAGLNISRFYDFTEFNSVDFFSRLNLSGPYRGGDQSNTAFTLGFNQYSDASAVVGDRVKRDVWDTSLNHWYRFSEKFRLNLGAGFTDTQYNNDIYFDVKDYFLLGGVGYEYSEKLTLNFNYRYRGLDYEEGRDDEDTETLSVGATGQLLPKVTGNAAIGIGFGDYFDNYLFYKLGLTWAVREKTSVSITGSRDENPSPSGATTIETDFTVRVNQRISDKLGLHAGLSWGMLEVGGTNSREDDIYGAQAGFNYDLMDNASLFGSLNYENRDSDYAVADYEEWRATLGGRVTW